MTELNNKYFSVHTVAVFTHHIDVKMHFLKLSGVMVASQKSIFLITMQMYAAQESNKVVASIEGTFGVEKFQSFIVLTVSPLLALKYLNAS